MAKAFSFSGTSSVSKSELAKRQRAKREEIAKRRRATLEGIAQRAR